MVKERDNFTEIFRDRTLADPAKQNAQSLPHPARMLKTCHAPLPHPAARAYSASPGPRQCTVHSMPKSFF